MVCHAEENIEHKNLGKWMIFIKAQGNQNALFKHFRTHYCVLVQEPNRVFAFNTTEVLCYQLQGVCVRVLLSLSFCQVSHFSGDTLTE